LKKDVNVPSKSNKQKVRGKNNFLLTSGRSLTKIAGSADPDPKAKFHGSATLGILD
jgi:hypothetical protein